MFLMERDAESADVLERVLYNAILHGISLSGTNTYYCNPLSDRDHLRDNCWVCCPPNLSRTLLQVGRYAYASSERDLYINLYVGGTVRVPSKAGEILLRVETDYPWDGRVNLRFETASRMPFALHLREPGWCDKAELQLNGARSEVKPDDSGFWTVRREWREGDSVTLIMDMPVQVMMAHPNIALCRGKVALQRGPLVYAFEGLDNDGDPRVRFNSDSRFTVERRRDLLCDVAVVCGVAANGRRVEAIPFYALANRGKSAQEVWVEQAGLKPGADWWLGSLYRPATQPITNQTEHHSSP
jgi:hypothetical protein